MHNLGLSNSPGPGKTSFVFTGNSVAAGVSWLSWKKPINSKWISMFVLGSGGGGGNGVIGATDVASGGGGGGSSGQTFVSLPSEFLPEVLYISVAIGSTSAGFASYVSLMPNSTANHVLAVANGGGVGGNASGATPGAAGSAGAIATAETMSGGWNDATVIAGQAGSIGSTNGAATDVTYQAPNAAECIELRCSGGTGGAGYSTAGSYGGGNLTMWQGIPGSSCGMGYYLPIGWRVAPYGSNADGWLMNDRYDLYFGGGIASTGVTIPPGDGQDGMNIKTGFPYCSYGGTGGASVFPAATTGKVQARGGNGGYGSGGGGMGGALTGSTAAPKSSGGNGLVIITVSF